MQSRDAALAAMEDLDEQHVFDATGTAISVRWADPELQQRKKKVMDDANSDNRMLFFAKVLRSTTEEEVRRMFTRFGKVHDVNLFRAFQGAPTTKGCGLVTMSLHSEAVAAIAALDGKFVWEGMDCPMVVKAGPVTPEPPRSALASSALRASDWMDTALQRRRREQHLANIRQPLPSASIGGLLSGGPRATHEQLPYTPYSAASQVTGMSMLSLGGGGGGPSNTGLGGMVGGGGHMGGGGQVSASSLGGVGISGMGMGGGGGMGGTGMGGGGGHLGGGLGGGGVSGMMGGGGLGGLSGGGLGGGGMGMGIGGMGGMGMGQLGGLDGLGELTETPPPGCHPDAMKLFVGNIPKSCTEDQLLPLFQSIGKVVELVIVYDKVSHESKGSAFVWYATRADAERAIIQFNLRHVFPDPSGTQDRPLVVRRAKARSRAVMGPLGMGPVGVFGLGQAGGVGIPYGAAYQRMGVAGMGGHGGGGMSIASLQAGMDGLQLGGAGDGGGMGMGGGSGLVQQMQVIGGGGLGGGRSGTMHMQMQGGHLIAIGQGGQQGLYDAYTSGDQYLADYSTPGAQGGGYSAYGHAMHGGGGQWDSAAALGGAGSQQQQQLQQQQLQQQQLQQQQQQQAVSLTLNQQQLGAVNQHLFSVQTVSGASLQLSPGAAGLFHLVISGSKPQVEAARNLVATVVSGGV